ncbi:hypothetical protein [Bacillus niameyensis]|uniref:hypothetical protein n=1 Tax=Bacillus niameyensis TaxID=1522308 RepID=UPI001E58E31C|nr:hypothetical protein [Bacillus niameyensis]
MNYNKGNDSELNRYLFFFILHTTGTIRAHSLPFLLLSSHYGNDSGTFVTVPSSFFSPRERFERIRYPSVFFLPNTGTIRS